MAEQEKVTKVETTPASSGDGTQPVKVVDSPAQHEVVPAPDTVTTTVTETTTSDE